MMKKVISVLLLSLSLACAAKAPPTLTTTRGIRVWQANEAVVALGTLQTVAIKLNSIETCALVICTPLLSDANTRIVINVVDPALRTIQRTPDGWRLTSVTALDQMIILLDDSGWSKLKPYVEAARIIVVGLPAK